MRALAIAVRAIDRFNDVVGRGVAWMTLVMVFVTFLVVVLRYVFNIGFVSMQEVAVWLHGFVFMLGAGYTLLHGGHVRVDLLYRPKGRRFKAWVDLGGSLFLLLPMLAMVSWGAVPYVMESWLRMETSLEAGGLPGLFVLKSAIPAFCLLVGIQGLALAGRSVLVLAGIEGFHPGGEAGEA